MADNDRGKDWRRMATGTRRMGMIVLVVVGVVGLLLWGICYLGSF